MSPTRAGRQTPILGLVAALLIGVAGARAQTAAGVAAADDRSVVLDELVVTVRPKGPAMWKAQKGDSIVVVLGGVSPLPHQQAWDSRRLEAQLTGAGQVLLPPSGRVSALDAATMALTASGLKLGRGGSLAASLPADLRARYLETLGLFGLKQPRYDNWKPAAAGFLMLSDFREKAGLSSAKPGSTVERMAKARHVRVRTVGAGSMVALFNAAKKLSPAEQQDCLREGLAEIDREADFARPVAAAWARGDLEAVRRSYPAPAMEACLLQIPGYRALIDRWVGDVAAQLQQALDQPGKTVAVVDLNLLIRRGGVLDRLKAGGATITVPLDGGD